MVRELRELYSLKHCLCIQKSKDKYLQEKITFPLKAKTLQRNPLKMSAYFCNRELKLKYNIVHKSLRYLNANAMRHSNHNSCGSIRKLDFPKKTLSVSSM